MTIIPSDCARSNRISLSGAADETTFLAMVENQSMEQAFRAFQITGNPWQADEVETPHQHDSSEWNLIIKGHARRMIGQEVLTLNAGTLLHVAAGLPHGMVHSSSNLRFWVIWDPQGDSGSETGARNLTAAAVNDCVALCRLVETHDGTHHLHDPLHNALRSMLHHHWAAAKAQVHGAALHADVQIAVDLLHAHGGQIDLQELAAQTGLSRSRLGHLFTEQMGMSLHTYRNRCKLQAFDAARRDHPDHDLASLAMRCGFSNYMQCYRAHCRIRGVPPSAQATD